MTGLSNQQSGNGLAPYLSKLGLHTEPFSNEIQDEFFLPDAQRLNMLYHLAQNSDLLLAVTGEQGSGKTTLLQHFIDMGDQSWRSCVIDANAMMNPEQLLVQIAEGFGLPQDSVNFGSGIEMLKKRLIEMKRSELISILIIDDAHELPAASLTMLMKLSELSDENEVLLRIVLFSEPRLVEILNASSLKDVRYRVTHTLEMPALNEQETINYVQHRLAVAGLKDAAVFSRNQLKKIYRLSGGIPGKINHHANEILLGGQPQAPVKAPAISMLVILAIGIGVTWFFTSDVRLPETGDPGHDAISTAQQTTRQLPLMPATPITPPAKISAEKTPVTGMTPDSTDNVTAESKTANSPVNAYALRQPQIQTKPITTPPTTKTTTATVPATSAPAPSNTDTPVTDDKVTVSKTTTPLTPKPVAGHWISRQNPEHFTLQVMGSHERLAITRVMHDHKLSPDKATVLHTRLNNKDWFILVYGSYSTPDKARTAVRTLPKDLQLTRPWPRQIGDIKLVK
jgi:DamX protein